MFSCVSETANPRVQSLSTTTPPCALPKRGINITSLSSLSLLVFSNQLPKLLSSISSCYDFLWLHSSKFNFWLEGW